VFENLRGGRGGAVGGVEGAIRAALEEDLGAVTAPGLARRAGVGAGGARAALAAFAEGPAGAGRGRVWLLGGWTRAAASGAAPRHRLVLCRSADLAERAEAFERVTVKQIYALSPGEEVGTDAGSLWRADAEHLRDLYSEPADLKNCLRDNCLSTIPAAPGVTRKGAGAGGSAGGKPPGKPLQNLQSSAGPPTSPPVPAGQLQRKTVEIKKEPEPRAASPKSSPGTTEKAGRAVSGGAAGSTEASGGKLASMFSKTPARPVQTGVQPEKKKRQARRIVEDDESDESGEDGEGSDDGRDEAPDVVGREESPSKKPRVEVPAAPAPSEAPGAPPSHGKKKEERTTINEKGEEITEVVWVNKEGEPCSPPPKAPPPKPQAPPQAAAAAPKKVPSPAGKKPGKQKGIASFFGRK